MPMVHGCTTMSAEPLFSEKAFAKVDVQHQLEVLDNNSTTFRSSHLFTVRAAVKSRFFERRYSWTGGDDTDSPEVVCDHDMWGHARHKVHGPVIREDKTRIVLLDLGRTLERGEEEQIHIIHSLRDLNGTFEPFMGQFAGPELEKISLS